MSAEAVTGPVPDEVAGWVGVPRHRQTADFPVERGYLWTSCASVENGNPLFWDDAVAAELTGGPVAPPTTLSLWFRPHHWQPGGSGPRLPLLTHFELKERLGLPEAIMSDSVVVFGEPVRPGDVIGTTEVLRSVSEPKTTRLGRGRFWVIDVEYRN
ncbi:MAG TPA: MaoC family dehydratase N-terminal domain-containing protein, partial [Acidimicrobiales bacterium]